MPRQDILRGPGAVIHDSATFFSKEDIAAELIIETDETQSGAYGNVGDAVVDSYAEVSLPPVGEWEDLTKLWPYASTLPGESIFGTDKPLVVHGTNGEKLTFAAGAITEMPEIICAPSATLIGPAKFTAIRAYGSDWSASNSLFQVQTAQAFSYAAFSKAAILRVGFAGAWGLTPWNDIRTVDGWRISFNLSIDWVADAARGRVDATFGDLQVMARCTPIGFTSAQIATAIGIQGGSARPGQQLESANNLVLTGSGGSPVITLNKPGIKTAGYRFGRTTLRHGELGFVAQRTFSSGVAAPLFTLA